MHQQGMASPAGMLLGIATLEPLEAVGLKCFQRSTLHLRLHWRLHSAEATLLESVKTGNIIWHEVHTCELDETLTSACPTCLFDPLFT